MHRTTLTLPAMAESAPAVYEDATATLEVEEGVRSFIDMEFPSPSLFDALPFCPESSADDEHTFSNEAALPTPPPEESDDASQEVDTWDWPESERIHLPPIDRWEDLACIRLLDRFYARGGLSERGHQILYRMCQIIWALGNEVEIRKKVKLPRAERLAKFQRFCDALLEGAQLFKKNMKAQMNRVIETTGKLPALHTINAYQDLRPKLNQWHATIQ